MSDLGGVGGDWNIPDGINERGQVTGVFGTIGDLVAHGFVWESGVVTDLGSLSQYQYTWAYGLNNRGQIVGQSDTDEGSRAFLWQDGVMTDLGVLDGFAHSDATDINARGEVVGNLRAFGSHPFVWKDGEMTDLAPDQSTAAYWYAWAVNGSGQIVGEGDGRAILWSPNSPATAAARTEMDAPAAGSAIAAERSRTLSVGAVSPVGHTPIEFEIRGLPTGRYTASIFDTNGRLMRRWSGILGTGAARDSWDGRRDDGSRAGTGAYFLRVDASGLRLNAKLLVLR